MCKRQIFLGIASILIPLIALFTLRAQSPDSSAGTTGVQEKENAKRNQSKKRNKGKKAKAPLLPVIEPHASLNSSEKQEDFPDLAMNRDGKIAIVFIEHDGNVDRLQLAGLDEGGQLVSQVTIAEPESGNIYQPCIAGVGDGSFLCAWSQLEPDGQWNLWARTVAADGKSLGKNVARLTTENGNDIFADLGADRHGRVWLTWQRMEKGINQVLAKHWNVETGDWSDEIEVTNGSAGNWEPRLAFGAGEEALIVFDSYRNGDFDLFLAKVSPDGSVGEPVALADTERYEARGEAACSPDGKELWVVYETGMERWGKDLGAEWRRKGGGLHHDREIKLIKVDLENDRIEKVADVTALLPDLVANPEEVGTGAIDVPEIVIDRKGSPWVFFRYCLFKSPGFWQTAFSRMDPESGSWAKAEILGNSAFYLDRRTSVCLHPADGSLKAVYPSDSRRSKQAGDSGIYLASIDPDEPREPVGAMPFDLVKSAKTKLQPFNDTPERARDDHHTWDFGGENYRLHWGDVHRHTDFSNCRTTDDGCIVEHYRYAIEAGGLDFLGTSDHTEAGKIYSDYEWWQTQKIADLFHNPGSFVSIYAYEREQKFPYGHRNVLFTERGGPIVYIKRRNYSESRWATPLPAPDGDILGDIAPWQLWDLLRVHGNRAVRARK